MAYPEGYDKKKFVPDPANRNGHIYYPETQEIFSVGEETWNEVRRNAALQPAKTPKTDE